MVNLPDSQMEAVGVEPTSECLQLTHTTCVALNLI